MFVDNKLSQLSLALRPSPSWFLLEQEVTIFGQEGGTWDDICLGLSCFMVYFPPNGTIIYKM